MTNTVTAFADNTFYALSNAYAVDGRVSSHPSSARGWAPMNCYLYVEGDHALVLDTGYPVHEESLISQLQSVMTPSCKLSILTTRIGEFSSVSNVLPLVSRFSVERLYGSQMNPGRWVDFRGAIGAERAGLADVSVQSVGGQFMIDVANDGARRLQAVDPVLRLLPTHWIYDEASRTLFTSDSFTHVWRDSAEGPWLVTEEDTAETAHGMTRESIRDYLLGSRFWWLEGADTDPIRRALEAIFDRYEIDVIAPGWGCVLSGSKVVERHYDLVQQVLAELGRPRADRDGSHETRRGVRS